MDLIERDDVLETLDRLLAEAAAGIGRVALIRGEAGIGKTSVVREFLARIEDAHVLWGGCDDMLVPRPLGPLWDMAFDEPSLEAVLENGGIQEALRAVLGLLSRSLRPTVMVVEDAHWADDATLDVLRYIGRRIDRTHGLVVLTYRDGGDRGDHPLRTALGDLPPGVVERIQLEPLSEAALERLAGDDGDGRRLWELTGGNPFFVTEAMAAGEDQVPVSIRDAVQSRVVRLSDEGRRLVEMASVSPGKIELEVVEAALGASHETIAECEAAGILELSGDSLQFRNELARRAVEDDLPEITRRQLNLMVLEVCERLDYDISRCAQHAREAEDGDAMLRILPEAARRASALQSHSEALATLRALEPFVEAMSPEQRADHLDLWAYEEYLRADKGLEIAEQAVAVRRKLDDPSALADSLLQASRIAWVGAKRSLAMGYAQEAAAVAGELGGEEAAMSYSVLSQLAMLGGFEQEAIEWGEKALALVGNEDGPVRAHALNNIGATKMMNRYPEGVRELVESREVAARTGLIHDETRACVNLAWNYLLHREPAEAEQWIDEALAVTENAEMPSFESYIWAEKAWWHEMRGEWGEAEAISDQVLGMESSISTALTASSIISSRIATRRGATNAEARLASAIDYAEASEEAQRIGPAYAVLAERHWLGGEVDEDELERCIEVMGWSFDHSNSWDAGEIGQWLALSGVIEDVPEQAPEPMTWLARGEWERAAEWWGERGIAYERAVALCHGDTEAGLQGLALLDELGAEPLARRVRARLTADGVKGIPRGPRRETRQHDLGLTARQAEVLDLLAEDLTNAEIADRLFISTRTVDHHVSAILAKLEAPNRAEAAQLARRS